MTAAIELFTYRDAEVRTVLLDGEPGFVHADVCGVLEIGNPSDALRRLDDDEHTLVSIDGPNGRRVDVNVITEAGLYTLILGSRKPQAKPFKRWVTHEVLPAIRQTGGYESKPALPQNYPDALRELAATVEDRERLAAENAELKPAAHSWHVLADATGDFDLRAAAQTLSRDPDIQIGQNQLAAMLRDELKWVDKRSRRPFQAQINNGRLAVRVREWTDPDTEQTHVTYQARLTVKGLEFLHRHLGGTAPLDSRQLALVETA